MTDGLTGLILDGLIIVLLAATVFYAVLLSKNLKTFRDGRADLEKLIGKLVDGISRAEETLAALRDAADDAGQELQSRINKARVLSDELQLTTEAADNLVARLEKGASQHGRSSQRSGKTELDAAFHIQDREFSSKTDKKATGLDSQSISGTGGNDDGGEDRAFLSRAERELYDALKGKRTGTRGNITGKV